MEVRVPRQAVLPLLSTVNALVLTENVVPAFNVVPVMVAAVTLPAALFKPATAVMRPVKELAEVEVEVMVPLVARLPVAPAKVNTVLTATLPVAPSIVTAPLTSNPVMPVETLSALTVAVGDAKPPLALMMAALVSTPVAVVRVSALSEA